VITLPIVEPNPTTGGLAPRYQTQGYSYEGPGEDVSLISAQWPLRSSEDVSQGIQLDESPYTHLYQDHLTDFEGPEANFQNGGITQMSVSLASVGTPVANPVDEVVAPWIGTGPSPYQLDTNIIGPVTGHSETMNGNTLQPDYNPQGQYGAATGGGTSYHETTTAYYVSQADQVVRDYSASALFASV